MASSQTDVFTGIIGIRPFRFEDGHEALAQLAEHLTFNQGVGGSSPLCLINGIHPYWPVAHQVRAAAL